MNRRDFLKSLGLLIPAAIVAPKLIFDLGAKKYRDNAYCPLLPWKWIGQGDFEPEYPISPYIYRETQSPKKLTLEMLKKFYEDMKRRPDVCPIVNGNFILYLDN